MIFIIAVYDNPTGHTLGFFGMQIALCLIALTNTLYVIETKRTFGKCTIAGTAILGWLYFLILLFLTAFKMTWGSSVLMYGEEGAITDNSTLTSTVDTIWMIFAAFLPLPLSFWEARGEPPLQITFL